MMQLKVLASGGELIAVNLGCNVSRHLSSVVLNLQHKVSDSASCYLTTRKTYISSRFRRIEYYETDRQEKQCGLPYWLSSSSHSAL
jgi:hypothetical protein